MILPKKPPGITLGVAFLCEVCYNKNMEVINSKTQVFNETQAGWDKMIDGEPSHENEPSPKVFLRGLGLVRQDLGVFPDDLMFDFDCTTEIKNHQGSRPWCIVRGIEETPWEEVIETVSDEHEVHMFVIGINSEDINKERVSEIARRLKNEAEKLALNLGEVHVYVTGDDEITVVGEEHFDSFWAKSILVSVKEYVDSYETR